MRGGNDGAEIQPMVVRDSMQSNEIFNYSYSQPSAAHIGRLTSMSGRWVADFL